MKKIVQLFVVINFSFVAILLAQRIEAVPNVVDARASAMGQTEILSTIGSNSLFINPAMMATLEKPQFQAGGSMFMGSIDSESADERYDGYDHSYNLQPKFTHASFVYPYQLPNSEIKLAFGGGYYTYYDFSANEEREYTYKQESGGGTYKEETNYSGGLNLISIGGSINFNKIFFVGLTYNTSINSGTFEEAKASISGSDNPDDDFSVSGEREKTFEEASFLNFSGFVKPTEKLGLGIFYRSEITLEGDKIKTKYNDGESNSQDWDREYTHPSVFGLSVAYNISKDFVVVGEYQTRPFSDYEIDNKDYEHPIDDGSCYRIGAEFNRGVIPLRAGFFSNAIFERAENDDDKAASLTGITAGTGFYGKSFGVDVAAEYSTYTTKYKYNDKVNSTSNTFFRFIVTAKYIL